MLTPIDQGTVIKGPVIPRSDMNCAPGSCQAIVPSIHPTRSVRLLTYTARPPEGGPFCYLYLATAAGILRVYDLRTIGVTEDCWGAFPFVSGDSRTVKVCVNARGKDQSADRQPYFFDTGLAATPTL